MDNFTKKVRLIICLLGLCVNLLACSDNEKQNKLEYDEDKDLVEETTELETEAPTLNEAQTNALAAVNICSRGVQYDNGIYTVLFGFLDENDEYLWLHTRIELKIINENNEIVYTNSYEIKKDNYTTWTSLLYGDEYLASINIDENEITKGLYKNGNVVLTVTELEYDYELIAEFKMESFELPYISAKDKSYVEIPQLPIQINEYDWEGNISGTLNFEKIDVKWEDSYDDKCQLTLTITGSKMYGEEGYVWFSYSLLDENGYIVESGEDISDKLSVGDKFNNLEITFYDLRPGNYKLKLYDYK